MIALSSFAASHAAFAYTVEASSGTVTLDSKLNSIRTGSDGRARVKLDDGTEVTLAPNSEISLNDTKTPVSSGLNLLLGKVRVLVMKLTSHDQPSWQMRSKNTVMGVRGTEFIVEATDDHTLLCTFEGAVEVAGKLVSANEGVVIDQTGNVSDPVAMDRLQMNWWRQDTSMGASASAQTQSRLLDQLWWWLGPSAVDSLDPNALYSEFTPIRLNGNLWSRFIQSETTLPRRDFSARLALNTTVVPNPNFLVFAEGTGLVKSGAANPENSGFTFHQGFALLRHHSSHSLAVGRQEWTFGDGLIVGRDPWSPVTRTFDGALATVRSPGIILRAFFATLNDRVASTKFQDLFGGAYLEFAKLPVEVYGFWNKRAASQSYHGLVGERAVFESLNPFVFDEELAYARGTSDALSGSVAKLDAGIQGRSGDLTSSLKAVFLQASSDFSPFFTDTHRFLGLVNAFPEMRNIQRLGATVESRYTVAKRPVTMQLDYSYFRRVQTTTANFLGNEIDMLFGFEPHPRVFFQLGGGYLTGSRYLTLLMGQFRF